MNSASSAAERERFTEYGFVEGKNGFNPHSPDDALNFGAACAIQI
jgi:hypothetical protein